MDDINWDKWAAVGQIVGAIGTFGAVATALYLAKREERPKLKLTATTSILVGQLEVARFV